eukprot:CAMPEP_0185793230 /NCGR_PEP_ID=MMETSP1174-20130828/159359_1 /TAXON_ID=35687 /ORGANISM="Dictyocha speculum, Strain CCMP1381" /LENGTH=51 /DNA_ID=CAMNT_0028488357 /DNA_START=606 /DNA_END=761 /DNA_ORIENTATION=-
MCATLWAKHARDYSAPTPLKELKGHGSRTSQIRPNPVIGGGGSGGVGGKKQ